MKLAIVFAVLLLFTFPPTFFVSQAGAAGVRFLDEDGETDDLLPCAEKVLERAILASGGYEVLGTESTSHWISHGSSTSGTDYVYEYYKAKGKFFSRFTYASGRIIERGVFSDGTLKADGKRSGFAWETINGGPVREMQGNELQEYLRRRTSVKKNEAKDTRFKSAKCVGNETINGQATYQLLLVDHDGTEIQKFYDVETGLVARRICSEEFNGRSQEVTRDYFDFKLVGQQMVSHRQTVSYGSEVWTYTTKLFETDVEIPDGTFQIPDSLKAKIEQAVAAAKIE